MNDDKKTNQPVQDDELQEDVVEETTDLEETEEDAEESQVEETTEADDDSEVDEDDDDEEEIPEPPDEQEVTVQSPNLLVISTFENKKARWYVVHTYSGHENKVAETLKQRAETLNLEDKILAALIPTQEKIQIKRGERKTVHEKIFPGYMLIKMELTDDSWLAVRTTQGITGFVGVGNKPTALPKHEVEAIMQYTAQAAPSYKAEYVEGEAVKITDGPFNDFLGTVNNIDEGKGQVEVLVNIFGRETPVTLDFLQVKKV